MNDDVVARLERQLAESEERFRGLVRAVTDYVYTVRVEGGRAVETHHGPGCVGVTGYGTDELAANPNLWIEMIPEEDRAAVIAQADGVLRGDEVAALEHRIVRKDGAVRWVSNTPVPHRDPAGVLVGYDGLIRDVTERKAAEAALRESEERYRRLFDTSAHALFLIGSDGRFREANRVAVERYGYTIGEFRRMTPADLAAADLKGQAPQRVEKALDGETRFAWRHRTKDGRVIPVEIMTKPLTIAGERFTFAEARDVTEQHRAEERIRFQAALLDNCPVAVVVHDAEGRFLYANQRAHESHGYTAEEFAELRLKDIDVPESRELFEARVREVMERGEAAFRVVHERKDGSRFPIWANPKRAELDGEPVIFAAWSDLTESERGAAALAENEATLRAIFEATDESVFMMALDGTVLACNTTTARRLGLDPEALVGRNIFDVIPAEQVAPRRARIAEALRTRERVRFEDERDGLCFDHSLCPVFGPGGEVVKLAVFGRDVTAQREIRRALVAKNEELDQYFSAALDLLCIADTDGCFRRLNPEWTKTLGYPLSELEGRRFLDFVHPDDLAPTLEALANLSEQRPVLSFTNRYRHADGSYRWIEWRSFPSGKMIYATARDITEQRRAQALLREGEERYRLLVDNALFPVMVTDAATGAVLFANEAACRFFEVPMAEATAQNAASFWEDAGDRERTLERLRADGVVRSMYTQMRTLSGTTRDVLFSSCLIEFRGVRAAYTLLSDITERVEAKDAVRESEEKFRTLFETMAQGVLFQEADGRISSANPAAERILGRSQRDLCSMTSEDPVWDAIHEDGSPFPASEHPAMVALATGREARGVVMGVYNPRLRERRWISTNAMPLFEPDAAAPHRVYAAFTDITESRRAEALLQAERDLGLTLSSAVSQEAALEACLETAIRVSGMDSGGVYLVTADGGLDLAVHTGLSDAFLGIVRRFAPGSPNATLALAGHSAYATHERIGIDLDARRREEHLRAVAVIPIRERGEVVACLNIASHTREEIPEWARTALEDVASRVGAVIVRVRAEEAQRRIERAYKTLFDEMLAGFAVHELICAAGGAPIDYRFLAVNPAFARMTGLSPERAVGRTVRELMPGTEQSWIERYGRVALEGTPAHFESYARELKRHFEVTAFQPRHGQFACIFTDTTERRVLEEQYNQAQKMEAVGRLAGGVAHDLNNLLTPILGYAEMLQSAFTSGDTRLDSVKEMYNAGTRAKDLVRQLLAFSRKQTLEFKRIDVNAVIQGFEKLLRRTLREDVRVSIRRAERVRAIRGDVGQIEQVLMNLAINSQDAMPDGGQFSIETAEIEVGEEHAASHAEFTPGSYVVLTVSDTGVGMDADTMARVFEPFFTTKPAGKGTGLGLATVYGIVKQHGGAVSVYSEVGCGTSFKLYFPALGSEPPAAADEERPPDVEGGGSTSETIMVVEDSEMVRTLAVKVLRRQGYDVYSAANAEECMQVLQGLAGPLHLLLTDVVMPDMNGRALYDVVATAYPGVRVIFMSGYPQEVISYRGILDENIEFLQKPFSVKALAAKIRAVLDKA